MTAGRGFRTSSYVCIRGLSGNDQFFFYLCAHSRIEYSSLQEVQHASGTKGRLHGSLAKGNFANETLHSVEKMRERERRYWCFVGYLEVVRYRCCISFFASISKATTRRGFRTYYTTHTGNAGTKNNLCTEQSAHSNASFGFPLCYTPDVLVPRDRCLALEQVCRHAAVLSKQDSYPSTFSFADCLQHARRVIIRNVDYGCV